MTRLVRAPLSLARKRIRATMNKWNIFNALTWRKNRFSPNTQYRQVFFAKQEARSYHGDRLTETQFRNHFRGDLPTVSPLRSQNRGDEAEIPHAMQTFIGLERRLDFAVWRSLFASSLRQAAVFILRGGVKVNGVKIRAPGYILHPGDLFSVEPSRVLYALGRPKPSLQNAVELTNRNIRKFNKYLAKCRANPEKMWNLREKRRRRHHIYHDRQSKKLEKRADALSKHLKKEMDSEMALVKPLAVLSSVLQDSNPSGVAKTVHNLVKGAFPENQDLQSLAEKYYSHNEPLPHRSDVRKLVDQLVKERRDKIRESYQLRITESKSGVPYDPKWVERLPEPVPEVKSDIAYEELANTKVPLPYSSTGKIYGLSEPKKPWFTPWSPRQFLAPMSILPHHIEVDHETCHAVYLRDPVGRPGHSEVISPFSNDMHERAYLWYVFRRRKNLPPVRR